MHGCTRLRPPVQKAICLFLTAAVALQSASCGTLIHPERVGQPPTGFVDPAIVLLDGLGLFVFLIPGVIGFIVDFSTGAIYLPPPQPIPAAQRTGAKLTRISMKPAVLTKRRIEAVIRQRTGKVVDLGASNVRVRQAGTLGGATALMANPNEWRVGN